MRLESILPTIFLAEGVTSFESLFVALLNYGALGLWVAWMLYREKRDASRQDARQDTQHKEHMDQQKRIEQAFRTNTNSLIVGVCAMQKVDSDFKNLLEKIKHENENPNL